MSNAATFVLVHGAWGGSYGFRTVRQLLHRAGHDAFTPSLTGIGERSHLISPAVDLSTHVRDVVNTVIYEDLDGIVLLGFSYGGMVVTGALDQIGDRVDHLVYLDAFTPADGDSAMSLIGDAFGGVEPDGPDRGTSWLIEPLPRTLATPEETAWMNGRRSPQPRATLVEPVQLSKPVEEWDFSRTFIKAVADENEPDDSAFWQCARRAQQSADWRYETIDSNHMVPLMRPNELAELLVDIAGS